MSTSTFVWNIYDKVNITKQGKIMSDFAGLYL
jgi:hypothetical protein